MPAIAGALARSDVPLVATLVQAMAVDARWAALLTRAIAAEPAAQVRDGGVIAAGFDAELDELRAIDDTCGEFLVALEARERARTGIANLKVEYNRVHGFYIEVTHANAQKIPDDYRRRQTLKNAERYITPELKTFEDRALSAQDRALAREKVLYEALVADLAAAIPALQGLGSALAALDVLTTLAERAEALDFTRPRFVAATGLAIRGGRHPVVERQIDEFIANDLDVSPERRLLVVTGPNMGGKSTYMRQAAVIALLAYCGSFVPARSAVIGPLDAIHTRIGAADDLAGGRSTFMVEMTEAAAILRRATPQSLVLIDEIGRGTSTFDGLALAWAIARELAEKNRSLALFATHYFELTALARPKSRAARTCISTRSSMPTASSSCTRWRTDPPTAATACRWRSSRACPPPSYAAPAITSRVSTSSTPRIRRSTTCSRRSASRRSAIRTSPRLRRRRQRSRRGSRRSTPTR